MNVNAIDELDGVLSEIEAKIQYIESSPNRVFVLVEYETINLFHWFNECFKQFRDEFDHSANQLLLFRKFIKKHSELSDRYVALFREQIDYLKDVIDFEDKMVKELPPVIFSEDNRTDVIGYYMDRFKDEVDENGEPLCKIDIDKDSHCEVIDGKNVPIDFYMFRSDELNEKHFKGLFSMYDCLSSLYPLISTVCSYPEVLQLGYYPGEEEIICTLDNMLRQYAKEIGQSVHRELKKLFLELKRTNSHSQPSEVWAQVLGVEADAFRLAISGKLIENNERIFDHYDDDKRKLWTANSPLLQKIKDTCIDDELFDVRLAVDTYNLLSVLNADNLDLFCELVLRRNIIHSEMFPELKAQYEEWLKGGEGQEDSLADEHHNPLEALNFFAPKKNLQELLKQAWFAEVRTDAKYDARWKDSFVEALMASEYGEGIARQWAVKGVRNKRKQLKAYIVGLLKDEGVLKGSYDAIATMIDPNDKKRTLATNMSRGKKQPYADWVKEYVSGIENIGKKE